MNLIKVLLLALLIAAGIAAPAHAERRIIAEDDAIVPEYKENSANIEPDNDGNLFVAILLYLPNRIFDAMDIFRARVRVGPGIAAGIRVTDAADLYLGSYVSMYAGLPGPRGRKLPRSPIGVETYNGAEISFAEATTGFGFGPDYAFSEVGVDAQIALVGFALSIDPVELIDFLAGIFTMDIMEDDYQD